MKSRLIYLNTMNLYLLIFCLFSLSCFSELDVIQSLNFHISCCFSWMSRNIGIISADISIFDSLSILWCHFKRNGKSKDFLNWKWGDFVTSCIMLWRLIGASCQHCGNAVNIKVGIHITMQYLFYHVIFILAFLLPLQSRRILYFLDFL